MSDQKAHNQGIRVEIPQGDNQAVPLDKLVDDLLHGKTQEALADLSEPHGEEPSN